MEIAEVTADSQLLAAAILGGEAQWHVVEVDLKAAGIQHGQKMAVDDPRVSSNMQVPGVPGLQVVENLK